MACEPELLNKKAKPAKARKLNLPPGVPPLTSLYMYISGSCNLACRHCWISPTYEPDNSKGQFLKLEYIKKAVREAKPLGLQSVKLTGGEPTLHPQFREIINFLNNEKIDVIIETNGTLIDKDLAKFLRSKTHVRFISVSLDGAMASTHDNLRGITGCFDQAVSGIKNLVSARYNPQIICTLHNGNVNQIDEIINFAETLGSGSVKFNIIQPMGRGNSFDKTHVLSVPEIIEANNHIQNISKIKFKIPVFIDIPIAFHSIKNLLRNSLCRCMIFNILGVTSNADLALCGIGTMIPELVYGNLGKNEIGDIWSTNKKLKGLRESIPKKLEGICGLCIYKGVCLGSCIANNYFLNKRITSSYYFCEKAFQIGVFPKTRLLT